MPADVGVALNYRGEVLEIEWISSNDLPRLSAPAQGTRALVVDLRDPLCLPLLKPEPTQSDLDDERRPGASDRTWFLPRRSALRSLTALYLGCDVEDVTIGYDGPGAPRVHAPSQCEISVSGRGSLAALAVSHKRVGVDLEILHGDVEVIENVLVADERIMLASMKAQERQRRFLQIWTAKEAFLKAIGTGLNLDPASVETTFLREGFVSLSHHLAHAEGKIVEKTLAGAVVLAACVTLPPGD